ARNDQLLRPVSFWSFDCFWQSAHFSFSLAHSAFARFHCFDVHFETSSTLEDDGGGVVVCARAIPDVTTPRTAAATSPDRTKDIVAGSLMRLPKRGVMRLSSDRLDRGGGWEDTRTAPHAWRMGCPPEGVGGELRCEIQL